MLILEAPSQAAASAPDKAFTESKAFEYARKSGRKVEITSRTTSTTRAWANPNGLTSVEVYAGPVRMRKDGQWKDFDLTLVKRADGSVAPKVHPGDLVLAGATNGAGEHDLATVVAGGERLGLKWRGKLPQPTLSGAKATYANVAPGVDLVVEARTGGFEQFLVLKDRAAAARVADLRLAVNPGKGKFDHTAKAWRDGKGRVIGRMPAAVMWDSQPVGPSGERPRQAKVDVRDSVVSPDLAWLNDPATQYPVTIDPGIEVSPQASFDEFVQNTINISDNQASSELKIGYSDSSDCMAITWEGCRARSYLRFDGLSDVHGGTIVDAKLNLWEFHSWSCSAYGWRATRTDPVDGWVQWGSQPTWRQFGDTSYETLGASSSCNDGWVKANATNLMQAVADGNLGSLSLVVHVEGDDNKDGWSTTNHNSWKKFDSAQGTNKPYLSYSYNHLPTASAITIEHDSTCGTGVNGRAWISDLTKRPTFRARVDDSDQGLNYVQMEVEVKAAGEAPVIHATTGDNAPGGTLVYQWPTDLDVQKTYTYRVRPFDVRANGNVRMHDGPWSDPCEFAFDTNVIDNLPIIEGFDTIDVDGELYNILEYGSSAVLTLRPDPADVGKVAGFRFVVGDASGIDSAPLVAIGPDGSASVKVSHWEADDFGVPFGDFPFHVRAVSIAGAHHKQASTQVWDEVPEPVNPTYITGDVDGDAKADLLGTMRLADGSDLVYLRHGNGAGGFSAPIYELSLPNPAGKTRQMAKGDFNGDGKSELVSLVTDSASNDIEIKVLMSDGNALTEQGTWISDGKAGLDGAFALATTKFTVGDVNGDLHDDLVVARGNGSTYEFKVFIAKSSPAYHFEEPVNWLTSITGDVTKIKLVTGFFDAGTTRDLGVFERVGACHTKLRVHANNSGSYGAGIAKFDNSNWCWDANYTVGEFDSVSGLTGIVATAFSSNDTNTCKAVSFFSFTSPYTSAVQQSAGNNRYWCADRVEPTLLDVVGDGRADLVVAYREAGAYQQRVWTSTTTGAPGATNTFAAPVDRVRSAVGPLGTKSILANPQSDVNNDDVADLGYLFIHGGQEVDYMTSYGSAAGSIQTKTAWSLPANSWPADRMLYVPGDFNGDGYQDGGFYYSAADGSGSFKVSYGSVSGPVAAVQLWDVPANSYDRYHITMQGGDFDGDGDDDLGVYVGGDDGSASYRIGVSNGQAMATPVQKWTLPAGSWDRYKILHLVGDFNGDNKDDAAFYFGESNDSGWLKVAYNTFNNNSMIQRITIPATGFSLAHMQVCGGDFTGDGKDDFGVLYTYGDGAAKQFMAITQTNDTMSGLAEKWYQGPGTQAKERVRIACADYNGDGLEDMGIMRTAADLSVSFHIASSTSTGVSAPIQQWSKVAAWGALPHMQVSASSVMVPVPPPPSPPPYCIFRSNISPGINVRTGPSTSNGIIGSVNYNNTVKGYALSTTYNGGYYWRQVYGSWGWGWAVTHQGSTEWLTNIGGCTYS